MMIVVKMPQMLKNDTGDAEMIGNVDLRTASSIEKIPEVRSKGVHICLRHENLAGQSATRATYHDNEGDTLIITGQISLLQAQFRLLKSQVPLLKANVEGNLPVLRD